MNLDLSFARAARVLTKEFDRLIVWQIGAGGTGSFAAMNIARVAHELELRGKKVELTIVDPDVVEQSNIPRSNFCAAEVGRFKAQTLAERIALAWGIEVGCINSKFEPEMLTRQSQFRWRDLVVIVGCVDNHLARRSIHDTLERLNRPEDRAPNAWWIDGGNGRNAGQVIIGSETVEREKTEYFSSSSICMRLPAPSLVHPELLEPEPVAPNPASPTTCAERIRLGEQGLQINQRVALELGQFLTELVLTQTLKRHATFFDIESGTAHSRYVANALTDHQST